MNTNIANPPSRDMVGERLVPKRNPTVLAGDRVALPHAISRIDVDSSNSKPAKRTKQNTAPIPAVADKTRRIVTLGVAFAGICAAALSAPTLYNLARLGRVPAELAWLLPACIDGYAITSIHFGNSVPAAHPAREAAKRNANVALLITVTANAAFHLLVLAGALLPAWTPVALLVVILSLPPIIVSRLHHLHSLASGTGAAETAAQPATQAAATPRTRASATDTPVAPPATATPAATVAPKPPATAPVAAPVAADGNNASVATLIPKSEQLQIVRDLVATHGPEVPLAEIIDRLGCHKSTASRLRAAVNEEGGAVPPSVGDGQREVI